MITHKGKQSVIFESTPYIKSYASVAGKKEGEGPLGKFFDQIETDEYFGQKSFEAGESEMLKRTVNLAFSKCGKKPDDADVLFSGDLLNQCVSSIYAIRDLNVPYIGIYGACSTMAEGLMLSSMAVASGFARLSANSTSSHFCCAERQFRFPLEYGSQRPPTAQWTATASGCIVLSDEKTALKITSATVGKIVDKDIKDAANMGSAMAPAFADTVKMHLTDLSLTPDYYDLIISGDLGTLGSTLSDELLLRDGIDIRNNHFDCGCEIYDLEKQDVHAGGSGCGCSASVLCGYILPKLESGKLKRVLFGATGALMSPELSKQGESIPGISHAVAIERA
ncbi:MAG: stage V sporulation protein AD [Clostridia bacterium]|nr:stage V sporulation protein AD [Clostridia bacterium]